MPGRPPPIGTTLDLGIPAERLHLFDPATEIAIFFRKPPTSVCRNKKPVP